MMDHKIDERLWIGAIHVVALTDKNPFPYPNVIGAYTNCITFAVDETDFRTKVKAILSLEGFDVTEVKDVERLVERALRADDEDDRNAIKEILRSVAGEDLETGVVTTEVHTYSVEDD